MSIVWRCKCGATTFNHLEWCGACGSHRPAPPPKSPSNTPLKELAVTEARFLARVGHEPVDDDLERCNCPLAGQIGHSMCGWDDERDLPRFIAVALPEELSGAN